jgi:hypothetical protein
MLFVTKDLREEMQELTHSNILNDDVTVIFFFFLEIMGLADVKKSEDLFLQFFSLNFLKKKFFRCRIHGL